MEIGYVTIPINMFCSRMRAIAVIAIMIALLCAAIIIMNSTPGGGRIVPNVERTLKQKFMSTMAPMSTISRSSKILPLLSLLDVPGAEGSFDLVKMAIQCVKGNTSVSSVPNLKCFAV